MPQDYRDLNPSSRILMGPGPSNVHPRVLRAMAQPLVGHLDPDFLKIMDETMALLRFVFKTSNRFSIPVSGTGSAGMEAAFVNVLEPGDRVVTGVNGVFGERMCDVASRCGAEVTRVEAPWGRIIEPEQLRRAAGAGKPKVIAVVHAETSTGAHQPLEGLAEIAREAGALLLVDTVTSLGGVEVAVDDWGIDICYSGTQKCLSCPPGLAPISFSERAMEAARNRKTKVQSWYLDMTMVERYWTGERFYHHTAPISMIYALREALRLIHEEGLEARWERHWRLGRALQAGLEALGLKLLAEENRRLPMLTAAGLPEGFDEAAARRAILNEYGIEIGGGLGEFKGKAWRVGLMGESCTRANVILCLTVIEEMLRRGGVEVGAGAGVEAAVEALS
jgi:alanine-glyoxylate transaminase/serine-glyoxylate transaminase/serine-pyruvate transaminase